jgi:hypothetical protein
MSREDIKGSKKKKLVVWAEGGRRKKDEGRV